MADVYALISASQPELSSELEELKNLANIKYFFQLTQKLPSTLDKINDATLALNLFEHEIIPIGEKLSPVLYMELCGLVLKKCFAGESADKQIQFLQTEFKKFDVLEDSEDAMWCPGINMMF